MKQGAYIPFDHLASVLHDSVADYPLALFACGLMIVARVTWLRRWRLKSSNRTRCAPPWSLAFHWPAYVWGLDALRSLWSGVFAGCSSGSREAMWYALLRGWELVYVSALSLVYVIIICSTCQVAITRTAGMTSGWLTIVPIPVFVAAFNVFFVNSAMLVLIATMAQE